MKTKILSLILSFLIFTSVFGVCIVPVSAVAFPEDSMYDTIDANAHPRLWIKSTELGSWKAEVTSSDEMKAKLSSLLSVCDTYISNNKPVEYSLNNRNSIFGSCIEVRNRLINLSVAYHLTGDSRYSEYAVSEMENVCGITGGSKWQTITDESNSDISWNVKAHYLDSGKLMTGMAFAYDMLYNQMSETQRNNIRNAIWSRYIDYAGRIYNDGGFAYKTQMSGTNWGAVCGTAQLMTALAIIDDYDKNSNEAYVLEELIKNSLSTLNNLALQFGEDGSWAEGVGYNEYMLEHFAWSALSLTNVFGSDMGLISGTGLKNLPEFTMHIQSPQGSYNFDSTTGTPDKFAPEAMLIAGLSDDKSGYNRYRDYYKRYGEDSYRARFLLFGSDSSDLPSYTNTRDKYWANTGLFTSRSDWNDEQALYLGVNGGYTSKYYNSHFDKGSFVFNTLGERWITDPGRNTTDTDVYLKRSDMHSCLVINPSSDDMGQDYYDVSQKLGGTMEKLQTSETEAMIVYDLKSAYGDRADSYKRGFFIGDNRRSLEVRDELILNEASLLNANFLTEAEITVSSDKKSAVFTKNGKSISITADCSVDGWYFTSSKAVPEGGFPEGSASDYVSEINKLSLVAPDAHGEVNISVKFTPDITGREYTPIQNSSLSSWSINENDESIKILNHTNEWYSDTSSIRVRYSSEPNTIRYYIDDELIGEATGELYNLGSRRLPIGSHTLNVRALYPNGAIAEDALSITVYKKNIIQSASCDFNTIDGANAKELGFGITTKSVSEVLAVSGVSGDLFDKALSLQYTDDKSLSNNLPYIEFSNFKDYKSGIAAFEFDIKPANPYIDYARVSNMSLWHSGSFNLYSKNKVDSTNVILNNGWNHFKITENYDKGTVTLELNGNIVYDGLQKSYLSSGGSEYFNNDQLRFELSQIGARDDDTRAGFTIDNIICEQYTAAEEDSYDVFSVSKPEISISGDKITAYSDIISLDNINRDVCIILAAYSDNELKAVSVNPYRIQAFDGSITAELVYDSKCTYKAFAVNNIDDLIPYVSITER